MPDPTPGVWLVLAACSACSYITGRYCSSHDTAWAFKDRPARRNTKAAKLNA